MALVQTIAWYPPWWRHQMETFSALLAICAGNSPVPGEFPAQRPVTRSFDVFFDLRPNKRLSKQWWGWWFKTPSCPLWRHCNDKYRALLLWEGVSVSDKETGGPTSRDHCLFMTVMWHTCAGLIPGLRPANERRRYFVTTSLIGGAQA